MRDAMHGYISCHFFKMAAFFLELLQLPLLLEISLHFLGYSDSLPWIHSQNFVAARMQLSSWWFKLPNFCAVPVARSAFRF
jgi:hypothetical protein